MIRHLCTVCMYVSICMYVSVCIYESDKPSKFTHMYRIIYVCMHMHIIFLCHFECMYVCMYVTCMHVVVGLLPMYEHYICMYVRMLAYTSK